MATAPITNTFQTTSAKGIREALSDVIYNISPTETPFVSSLKRKSVTNVLNEWQQDALATAVTTNAQIEGDDIGTTFEAVTATVRYSNYVQIFRKTVIIADTQNAVDLAGRKDETAYQVAKKGAELKRDIEATLLCNQGASAGSTSVARKTGSFLAFMKTNVNKNTDGTIPVYTSGAPTDVWTDATSTRAFTEVILKDVMQQCFVSGGTPTVLSVGAVNKQLVSAFAGSVTKNINQTAAKASVIIGAADVYVSDFGTLSVIANRFQRSRSAHFIDFDFVSLDVLRPMKTVPLAKTGDAEKRMLITEIGLRVGTEKAHGIAVDLS